MLTLEKDISIQELARKNDIFIVQFSSETCAPCTSIRVRIDAWLKELPSEMAQHIASRHVSIDENPEMAAQNQVLSFPTVVVYVYGKETIHESGYFSLDNVFDRIERYLKLMQ